MLKTCAVFWKSEPQNAYKRFVCKKNTCILGRAQDTPDEQHVIFTASTPEG